MTARYALVALLTWGTLLGSASAEERYYMMIFGSQTEPFTLNTTHTFALFVKATGDGKEVITELKQEKSKGKGGDKDKNKDDKNKDKDK